MSLEEDIREEVEDLDREQRRRLASMLRLVADFVETPHFRRCCNCRNRKPPDAFRGDSSACADCQWKFGL